MKPNFNLHQYVKNAPKVAVFGSDGDHCSPEAEQMAYDVGTLLGQNGAIVFNGGGSGVMRGVSRGVTDVGGLCIGILPGNNHDDSNGHCSITLPTGIGYARAQILVNAIQGAILIEGGIGTLIEACEAYYSRMPIVAITSSGGTAADLGGKVLDRRKYDAIIASASAQDAVDTLLKRIEALRLHPRAAHHP